jgi:hypothetical protein
MVVVTGAIAFSVGDVDTTCICAQPAAGNNSAARPLNSSVRFMRFSPRAMANRPSTMLYSVWRSVFNGIVCL